MCLINCALLAPQGKAKSQLCLRVRWNIKMINNTTRRRCQNRKFAPILIINETQKAHFLVGKWYWVCQSGVWRFCKNDSDLSHWLESRYHCSTVTSNFWFQEKSRRNRQSVILDLFRPTKSLSRSQSLNQFSVSEVNISPTSLTTVAYVLVPIFRAEPQCQVSCLLLKTGRTAGNKEKLGCSCFFVSDDYQELGIMSGSNLSSC